jgi:galactokinase
VDTALVNVAAPGRVNLIGEHTDYNLGYCLPIAIDRSCTVSCEPATDGRVHAESAQLDGAVDLPAEGSADPMTVEPRWGRFVAGVLGTLAGLGRTPTGARLAISSTVPAGSGLSSSSALSVALTLGLAAAGDLTFADPRDAAKAALDGEVRATGVPGGLMDQLCSLLGVEDHALLLDCRSLEVTPILLPPDLAVLVVHSGQARTLVGSEYAERRAACTDAAARVGVASLRDATLEQVEHDRFARHVVTENARVLEFVDALGRHDNAALGRLLLASHASLRDDFAVSTAALDVLVDLLVGNGALGARLTGAGFGGCVVALIDRDRVAQCAATTTTEYREQTGLEPRPFVVRAVAGAHQLP